MNLRERMGKAAKQKQIWCVETVCGYLNSTYLQKYSKYNDLSSIIIMVDKYTVFLLSLYFLDYIFLIERVFVHAYCHYPPQKKRACQNQLTGPLCYYLKRDYSATRVKRLKSTICSSLFCWASHCETVALSPSPNWNSWSTRQFSFRNFCTRPLAMFSIICAGRF